MNHAKRIGLWVRPDLLVGCSVKPTDHSAFLAIVVSEA